jgi:hypothetical protein
LRTGRPEPRAAATIADWISKVERNDESSSIIGIV